VDDYFPLTPGSNWTYRIQDHGRRWTYQSVVRVYGERFIEALGRSGIAVEERYSGGGIYIVEEQEPIVYFKENGFLNRVFLTYQAEKMVAASGSGDRAFLPETLREGTTWTSDTTAFRVGDLGFQVTHQHVVAGKLETVKVPAGTFGDCIRIDTASSQGKDSGRAPGEELRFFYADWYAPGVGLVRTLEWEDEEHSKERARIELLKYAVASPGGTVPAGGD
jgi:hypothetical protein